MADGWVEPDEDEAFLVDSTGESAKRRGRKTFGGEPEIVEMMGAGDDVVLDFGFGMRR